MSKLSIFISSFFCLSLVACSNSSGDKKATGKFGGGPQKLTSSDKTKFNKVATAVGAVNQFSKSKVGAIMSPEGAIEGDAQLAAEVAKDLSSIVNEKNCKISSKSSEEIGEGDFVLEPFEVNISGADCPISLSVVMTAKEDKKEIRALFKFAYKSVTEEAKQISDLSELTYSGGIKYQSDGSKIALDQEMLISFEGSGESVSEGKFSFKVINGLATRTKVERGNAIGGTSGIVNELLVFSMKNMAVRLEGQTTLKDDKALSRYSLNGVEVSAAEATSILKKYRSAFSSDESSTEATEESSESEQIDSSGGDETPEDLYPAGYG